MEVNHRSRWIDKSTAHPQPISKPPLQQCPTMARNECPGYRADRCAGDYIGGVVPAQVDPGEANQPRADVERNTELGIPRSKKRCTGESVSGVTRRERRITDHIVKGSLTPDNLLHPPNDYTRADESGSHQPARLAVFITAISHQEERNPQHCPAVAKVGADLHDSAERLALGRCIVDCIKYPLIQSRQKIALIGVSGDGDKAKEQRAQGRWEGLCFHRLTTQAGGVGIRARSYTGRSGLRVPVDLRAQSRDRSLTTCPPLSCYRRQIALKADRWCPSIPRP